MEFRHAFQCLARTAITSRCQPSLAAPTQRLFSTSSSLLAPPRAAQPITRSAPSSSASSSPVPRPPSAAPVSDQQRPGLLSTPAPWDIRSRSRNRDGASRSPKPIDTAAATEPSLTDILSNPDPSSIATFTQFKIDGFWESYAKKREQPALRLKPSTGRTVYVSGHVDIARSFQLLTTLCRRNKVSADFSKQRFHERPGLKRKRLRSQRWRARFREGFKATCDRVLELRRQGW